MHFRELVTIFRMRLWNRLVHMAKSLRNSETEVGHGELLPLFTLGIMRTIIRVSVKMMF